MIPKELKNMWADMHGIHPVKLFFSEKSGHEYECFSNFYISNFKFQIPDFCPLYTEQIFEVECSEKAIMLCKASLMGDGVSFRKILLVQTPKESKRLGREVINFNQQLWDNNVCRIARYVCISKFSQVDGLSNVLKTTAPYLIAEASPRDRIWGIGMGKMNPDAHYPTRWRGSNILGWALMQARDELCK